VDLSHGKAWVLCDDREDVSLPALFFCHVSTPWGKGMPPPVLAGRPPV